MGYCFFSTFYALLHQDYRISIKRTRDDLPRLLLMPQFLMPLLRRTCRGSTVRRLPYLRSYSVIKAGFLRVCKAWKNLVILQAGKVLKNFFWSVSQGSYGA